MTSPIETSVRFLKETKTGLEAIPFNYKASYGRVEFEMDELSRITKKDSLGLDSLLYDSALTQNSNQKYFSLPLEEAFYSLYTKQNGVYFLEINVQNTKQTSLLSKKTIFAPWIFAVCIHLALFTLSLLFLSDYSFFQENQGSISAETSTKEESQKEVVLNEANSNQAPVSQRVAFSGFSLWKLLEGNKPKPTKEERIVSFLQKELGNANNTVQNNSGATGGTGKSSLINFSIGRKALDISGLAKASGVAERKTENTLSPAERAKAESELKNKMDMAQKQMRGFYGQALRKDPSFNTRVVITARISANGHLDGLMATPQGHNQQQSALAAELASSIQGYLKTLTVPAALAGHTIRREFIFWK